VKPENQRPGLHSIFRSLGDLLQIAAGIAENAGGVTTSNTVLRAGRTRLTKRALGVFDLNLRVGGRGAPVIPRTKTGRRQEQGPADVREPNADVFDEGDFIVVVVEIPGSDPSSLHWSIHEACLLTIRAEADDRKYLKELELPAAVNERAATSRYVNGVLELKLWKQSV
jgi:HSP20 family protein